MTEFTGERVIPGQVEDDLWAEHIARYAFAARYAVGKRVLDLGCGTGYGSAELATVAREVTGVDNSFDAVAYATEHYPQARFFPLSAAALPFPDRSFDLVTAFELIEHLSDWRAMLAEARRVLDPAGLLIVSTPNKLYYAEARGAAGANPFHAHEFEFAEFEGALREVFSQVRVWLQDRVEGFGFYGADLGSGRAEARLQAGRPASPADSNFFVGLCSESPLPEGRTFLYVPGVGNLLRERERHIALLERELVQVRGWLAETTAARDQLLGSHAALEQHLDEQNRWGRELETLLRGAQARVVELQEQFQAEQTRAAELIAGLNEENRRKTEWALETERRLTAELEQRLAQLAEMVRALEQSEATVVERTRWAQDLDAQLAALRQQMAMVRQSRWIRLGRQLGLGPQVLNGPGSE